MKPAPSCSFENYCCPPLVIELANALIEKNLNRSAGKKPLKAVKQGERGEVVRIFSFNSVDEEAVWIAQDISQRSMEERATSRSGPHENFLIWLEENLKRRESQFISAARKDEFKNRGG